MTLPEPNELPVVFECAGERLLGVVSMPNQPIDTGVLMLVGGRQYRAGSHRQFVLLSRRLASADFCCLRFDFRGMGDSTGEPQSFEAMMPILPLRWWRSKRIARNSNAWCCGVCVTQPRRRCCIGSVRKTLLSQGCVW